MRFSKKTYTEPSKNMDSIHYTVVLYKNVEEIHIWFRKMPDFLYL